MNRPRKPRPASRANLPFLVQDENQFAWTAINHLESTGRMLLISGPSGTGKSHLCELLQKQWSSTSVSLLAGHEFVEQAEQAVEQAAAVEQLGKLATRPVFILEDLHFLSRSRVAQGTLASLLDEMRRHGVSVVITSLYGPGELRGFSPRVINRLRGGVCAHVSLPGQSSREKLLQHFCSHLQIALPVPVVRAFARTLAASPRELLATLLRFEDLLRLQRTVPDAAVVRRFLSQEIQPSEVTVERIAQTVAREFGVRLADMRSEARDQSLALPRHCAMFLARELTGKHFAEIGQYFNGRNHSTVLHACQRVRELLPADPGLRQRMHSVRSALHANSK